MPSKFQSKQESLKIKRTASFSFYKTRCIWENIGLLTTSSKKILLAFFSVSHFQRKFAYLTWYLRQFHEFLFFLQNLNKAIEEPAKNRPPVKIEELRTGDCLNLKNF